MRIVELRVRGFRSLREVHLNNLSSYVVMYGPNGAGKSNILAAIALFAALWKEQYVEVGQKGRLKRLTKLVAAEDFFRPAGEGAVPVSEIRIGIRMDFQPDILRLNENSAWDEPFGGMTVVLTRERGQIRCQWLNLDVGDGFDLPLFALVPAVRSFEHQDNTFRSDDPASVAELVAGGRLCAAAIKAQLSPSSRVAAATERLHRLLGDPPLRRPPYRPINENGKIALQEYGPSVPGGAMDVAQMGFGIVQIYQMAMGLAWSGARVVGVEEPEAHLHERTTARQVRAVLRGAVVHGLVDQLFVATHSDLFDLDAAGFYDVAWDPECGSIIRHCADLIEIDNRHIYAPGPAIHALKQILQDLPPETPIARGPDGSLIDTRSMLQMLIDDDDRAFTFLQDVNDAAVNAVRRSFRVSKG